MRSAIIFAGGKATRLGGVNKALLDVGGQPIINRILDTLATRVDEALAVVNDASLDAVRRLRTITDPNPHAGVLPALEAGLSAARGDLCLVVACDMPFVSGPLFDLLLSLADGYDLVLPMLDEQAEPMHAVYRRAPCLAAASATLQLGQRRMIAFHPDVHVRRVGAAELRTVDPDLRAFLNVNSADDLEAARRLVATE